MSVSRLVGSITCSAALAAMGMVAFAAPHAAAAELTASWDASYYLPGEKATLAASGCAAGATVSFALPGEEETIEVKVPEDGKVSQSIVIPENVSGALSGEVQCREEGAETTGAKADAYILGKELKAVPQQFNLGDSVTITAGEFVPGSSVTLRVKSTDNSKTYWTTAMGTTGEDRTVVRPVTFPTTLACGQYAVVVGSEGSQKDNTVEATLRLCGADPTPTPSPSQSATTAPPSTSPSAKPTSAPSASVKPTAEPTSTSTTRRPGKPGVPSTGI